MDLSWKQLAGKIDKRILKVIKRDFKFAKMTPVQAATIPLFLGYKDVAVEAVTGSGKTLAFIIPLVQAVLRKRLQLLQEENKQLRDQDVVSIVISPTRELAIQIFEVLERFSGSADLKGDVKGLLFVGGSKREVDELRFASNGAHIIVSTPGRLADLLERCELLRSCVRKHLEVLILDEADQMLAMGFEKALNLILSYLPRQRRTGLFSATQTKQLEQLIRAGLRNPVSIEIKAKQKAEQGHRAVAAAGGDEPQPLENGLAGEAQTSTGLQMSPFLDNRFIIVDKYLDKISMTLDFVTAHSTCKFLIFFSTCAQVDYFSETFEHFLAQQSSTLSSTLFKIHRKVGAKRRNKVFDTFRNLPSDTGGVLLCTDVMSRGIDFPSVDWVIHFDLPNTLQHYIHRSGRSGHQLGQHGRSLLLLLSHEQPYVQLCRAKQIDLRPLEPQPAVQADQNDSIVNWIREEARRNAAFYQQGMQAFVSFVRNYSSSNVLSRELFEEMDVIELVNSYGLLKIPKMPELRGKLRASKTRFERAEGDKELAAKHTDTMHKVSKPDKCGQSSADAEERKNVRQKLKQKRKRMRNKINLTKLKGKRKKELIDDLEMEELAEDARMVKKLRKGKINEKDFDAHFGI